MAQRVAIYVRVSTDDKDQDPETQLYHLRNYAELCGHKIVAEFVDVGLSAKTIRGRVEYQKMMHGVDAGRYDAVMAYKLDRLHRNLANAIMFVDYLRARQVALILTSQLLDTSTAMGMAMMQITAVFAELESANTAERSKIGTERAKAQGKVCNRPLTTLSKYQIERAKEILAANPNISNRELAENFNGISRMTLIKKLREEGVIE